MVSTRDRLTAALVRLVAERGLDAVSVREVAAAASVTGGTVQHHFPTKQAMLVAALETVTASFQTRAEAAVEGREPRGALRALARQLVPLTAEQTIEARVWLAFVARAAVDAELATLHRAGWAELEDVLAALIRGSGVDPSTARVRAGLLLATLDGLATGGVVEPDRLPPDRLAALVDVAVAVAVAG